MSYAKVRGYGADEILTQDPPPNYYTNMYCKAQIAQTDALKSELNSTKGGFAAVVAALQAKLTDSVRVCDARMSAAAGNTTGASAALAQAMSALQSKLAASQAELDALRASSVTSVGKCRSCLIWMIVAATGVSVAIVQSVRKKNPKAETKSKSKSMEKVQ